MGHLYRALHLSNALAKAGISSMFYVNDHTPSRNILVDRGIPHEIVNLEDFTSNWESDLIQRNGLTLWVNDRLNTDIRHTKKIKSAGIPLVTFDDRGTGASLADLHIAALSFNVHECLAGAKILRGLDYLILNPEISAYTRLRKELNSILVTLGGSDTYGVTVKVVQMLKEMGLFATVVTGPSYMHADQLEDELTSDFILKHHVPSLIEEFFLHDLAITGGGITPFEANASGLPCVVVANELFEIPVGMALQNFGSSVFSGYYAALNSPLFPSDLSIANMSLTGIQRIGLQGTQRVLDELSCLVA